MSNPSPTPAPHGPCVRTETCVVVLCAGCGEHCHHDGIPHYSDLPAARTSLQGWDWTDPARPCCPACLVTDLCRREGHLWGPWQDCACQGRIAGHAGGCRRHRFCLRERDTASCPAMQAGDRKPAGAP